MVPMILFIFWAVLIFQYLLGRPRKDHSTVNIPQPQNNKSCYCVNKFNLRIKPIYFGCLRVGRRPAVVGAGTHLLIWSRNIFSHKLNKQSGGCELHRGRPVRPRRQLNKEDGWKFRSRLPSFIQLWNLSNVVTFKDAKWEFQSSISENRLNTLSFHSFNTACWSLIVSVQYLCSFPSECQ